MSPSLNQSLAIPNEKSEQPEDEDDIIAAEENIVIPMTV
jgi:hypothetical protein